MIGQLEQLGSTRPHNATSPSVIYNLPQLSKQNKTIFKKKMLRIETGDSIFKALIKYFDS